ncbi:MAG: ABC transporter ATP-binding protein [Treponema sp.]|mgnify:CR=1 FL=1|uniref:ABC transporter ATP-binding protein n=1 Tax=Treponema sp. TaxID=166 RepID=UPI001B5B805E|nr:ABC transporter ATP-binding protein [Treponema sp.]MBP3771169.1 ABC transporter ATP-binding protein [Treponema sp.]MBQ9280781.1 ABC transporter ATP-binding protein [Treponema sp.]
MEYFSADNVKLDWEDFHLDLSLSCPKNTMTSIVGPSGSGKSTLLRLIAGLERPAPETKITLDGKDITKEKPAKRGVGMVFQKANLFNHLRVDDNVAYGLRCAGMKKKESREKAADFLKKFNLEGFGPRAPETLSGGEAQRVALARTLIVKPKLILFDEPLSALDAPLRKKLAAEIRSLQKEFGFTGIMVTHDISEAKAVSDKIILIKAGKLVWEGNAEDFTEEMISG